MLRYSVVLVQYLSVCRVAHRNLTQEQAVERAASFNRATADPDCWAAVVPEPIPEAVAADLADVGALRRRPVAPVRLGDDGDIVLAEDNLLLQG